MAIFLPEYKVAYMAVPKAGCSSVKAALAHLDSRVTIPPAEDITVMTWHKIYPTTRFRQRRWNRFTDFYRFTVVRDPARRMMSVYTNRVVHFRDLHSSWKMQTDPNYDHLSKDPDPDFFFQNLRDYMKAASVIKHHCLGTQLFIGPHPLQYDRVYRTEDMGELAHDLSRIVGKPVEMPRENSSDIKLSLGDLAPKTIDAIRPMLDEEYAHLSDYFENPL